MHIKQILLLISLIITINSIAGDTCFKADASTLAHWEFNDNIKDSGPLKISCETTKAKFIKSKFGKAIVAVPNIKVSDNGAFEKLQKNFTIKVVFKLYSLQKRQQTVLRKLSTKPHNGFLLQILNNKPLFCFYNAQGKQFHIYGPRLNKKNLNKWISLIVSYDGERMVMYIDGRNVASKKISNITITPGKAYLYIGSAGSKKVMQGAIDEILITSSKKIEQQTFKTIPGAFFFNFSHPNSEAFSGFEKVGVNTLYAKNKKYGWVFSGKRGENQEQFFHRTSPTGYAYPDNLTGTSVHFRGGKEELKFIAKVKDGKYSAVLYLNAFADGGIIYNSLPYKVFANGKKVIDHKFTRESFSALFYREFDDKYEWRPGSDLWKKYLKDEVNIYQFPVTAKDGKIEFEFQVPARYFNRKGLFSINALIIVPDSQKGTLDKTLKAIEKERRRQFYTRCEEKLFPEKNKLPKLSGAIKKLGYIPFSRYYMKQVFPNTIPLRSEIEMPVSTFAAQGQRQIATFSIYPLKTLKNVKISINNLKSTSNNIISEKYLKILRIRYIEEPLNMLKANDYSYIPLGKLLVKNKAFTIENTVARRYVLEINTPVDAVPGKYSGIVSIKPENAPEYKLKVFFQVYPFKLESYADDDERIWIYYPLFDFKTYKGFLWDDENKWERIKSDIAMMKKYSIAPTIGFNWFMDDDDLKRFMDIYQKHNFRGLAAYGGYTLLNIIDRIHKTPGKHGNYNKYIKRIKHVEALRKKQKWPKFAYYTTAEVHNGMPGYIEAKWAIEQLKKAAPEASLFCLPNKMEEIEFMLDSKADIIGPNAISMREEVVEDIKDAGKKLWFYCWGRERFRCGLAGWRLGNRGGLKEWWTVTKQKPLNPYDTAKFFDTWNDSPPYEGPNGAIPTMGLEETTAGRLDFLYLATLELWLKRAEKINNPIAIQAKTDARKFLDALKRRIKKDYYFYYSKKKLLRGTGVNKFDYRNKEKVFNWPVRDYVKTRRQAANLIVKLKETIAK